MQQLTAHHARLDLQGRFHVKNKFEGVREDEAESLQADLAPLASDSLRYGTHCSSYLEREWSLFHIEHCISREY